MRGNELATVNRIEDDTTEATIPMRGNEGRRLALVAQGQHLGYDPHEG